MYIMDDKLLEINETFKLWISSNSLPNNVIVTSPNETTVIIIDDDCKPIKIVKHTVATTWFIITDITIRFNQSSYSVDEDDGVVQPILVFSNPSSTNITVYVRNNSNNATGE